MISIFKSGIYNMVFSSFLPGDNLSRKRQYLVSVSAVCLVSAVCFLFSGYIGSEVVAFLLLLTLSFIAMFFDIYPVLLTAFLSALIWDFFFLHPMFNFQVGNTEDKIMLSMYFVIASVNAVLTFKIRQVEKIARDKEEKAQTLKLYHTLLNSLSHEFRTPIATIIGATDNLLGDTSRLSQGDKDNLLSEISKASLRLNRQVENLLNMSRLESGFLQPRKEWCDISELVYDVVQKLDEPLKNYTLKTDIPENLPLFKVDYGLMEQVLYNLVNNAIHYTPPQTEISISASHKTGEALLITVADNGPGFPEGEGRKVFEKFYRAKNALTGGIGLGLSIVKGFVEAHDGTVILKNDPAKGAVFQVKIPAEEMLLTNTEK